MKLVETWVKASFLKGASLLLLSECAQDISPDVCKRLAEGRMVLTTCPEVENAEMIMGKLAAILTCSNPSDLTVLTMEGSPHCLALHAAANEALFITKAKVPLSHFVILEGKVMEVSSESVRVARYLHLVQKCIQKCPDILKDLNRHSLEHRCR
ncbi:MAG: 4Fe-4S ferredoxin [Candidatus Bathyarchaeota archaeon]|nr:MAG: 4Fe-4S ferredoxin [Candidatus Bathyarchaeota archaeon]